MTPTFLFGRAGDDADIERIGAAIREWEPCLDLLAAHDDPRIYEPDGTLYAVGLTPEASLLARHKRRAFRRGDLIVVPRSVAIDAEDAGASYLAIRHDGTPPYHFRERFIQTWGYEHKPCPGQENGEIVPEDDARYRVPYRRVVVGVEPFTASAGLDLHLFVVLEGRGTLGPASTGPRREVGPDDLALVAGDGDYSVEGRVSVGRFLLRAESAHEARLLAAAGVPPAGWSPEYQPEG